MRGENVIYVDLPKDTKFRKAEVAEGKLAIIYDKKAMPKPTPLKGGTEVYQKEGVPYWYCKIKEGDEFMHIDFSDLTDDDLLYCANGIEQRRFVTESQKKFRENVIKALKNKPKEGFRWVQVSNFMVDEDGNLHQVSSIEEEETLSLRALTRYEWERLFKDYSPENISHMASDTTYFLLLLRWIKDGKVTIEQLVDNPKKTGGQYWSPEYEFGGLKGFASEHIYKCLKNSEGFWITGDNAFILSYDILPLTDVRRDSNPNLLHHRYVGFMELEK